MPDIIDLSNDSDDEQKAADDAARKRIMEFAAAVNASKRQKTDGNTSAATASATTVTSNTSRSELGPEVPKSQQSESAALDSNALLAQLHAERMQRLNSGSAAPAVRDKTTTAATSLAPTETAAPSKLAVSGGYRLDGVAVGPKSASLSLKPSLSLKLLTYNVWFKEEVALEARMEGLGKLIEQESYPHVICLQEVTHNMVLLWKDADWFDRYVATPPAMDAPYFTMVLLRKDGLEIKGKPISHRFENSVMGRGVKAVAVEVGGRQVLVATSHLESPTRGNKFTQQRKAQAEEALSFLESQNVANTIWAGDLNWNREDGPLPLLPLWQDAWPALHPDTVGYTYSCKDNPMLTFNFPGKRLDRVVCKLADFQLDDIRLVGTQALPGQFFTERGRNGNKRLPVLISDHFGLLLTLKGCAEGDRQ